MDRTKFLVLENGFVAFFCFKILGNFKVLNATYSC